MSRKIYFDLDGTLYNLYATENWLEKIRNEVNGIFSGDNRMFENNFYKIVSELLNIGYEFGVITWLPMQASPEYEEICRHEKMEWIKKYLPFVSEINIIPYGTPKQNAIQKRAQIMYLIDDNTEVGEMWKMAQTRLFVNVNNTFTVEQALQNILDKS